MNILARSLGNAFRNKVRSASVIVILAVAIGLALSMLVAHQAVTGKVADLKGQIGTELTVSPAGARGFEGGGEPLTGEDLTTVGNLDHVSAAAGSLDLRLSTAEDDAETGTEDDTTGGQGMGGGPGGMSTAGSTSLESAVDPGTLGNRNNGGGNDTGDADGSSGAPSFPLPITATGTDAADAGLSLTAGTAITDYAAGSSDALLGTSLAEHNGLAVGDSFEALGRSFTVTGIFDAGTEFDNNTLYLPLAAAQELSGRTDELSAVTVTADSMENVEAVRSAIADALGSDRVDVAAGSTGLSEAIDSLAGVQSISLVGFIAALVTAGLIVLLVMIMVVRERRREIGVLKAVGAPNRTIAAQFVLEALVLVVIGAVVGSLIAFAASGPVASALVDSGTDTAAAATAGGPPGADSGLQAPPDAGQAPANGAAPAAPADGGPGAPFGQTAELIGTVTTTVGAGTIAFGALGILFIAALGALVPALLTARIRPIEVLRGE